MTKTKTLRALAGVRAEAEQCAGAGFKETWRGAVMTREQAIELGRQDGIEDVETVLAEQGIEAVRATLAPGHLGWDEGAINAGVAQIRGVPEEHRTAYYEEYARTARARAGEVH